MEISRQEVRFWDVLVMIFILGLGLIVIVRFLPEAWVLRRFLVTSVGETSIVATVLGLTVDRYLKGYLIRNASQDVYKYLVGYNLPDEIKARLQALVGLALVRHNREIAYRLTPVEGPSTEVLIDVNYSFELENISNTIQKYTLRIQAEKYLNPRIVELRCDDPETKFRLIAADNESLGRDQSGLPGVIEAHAQEIDGKPSGGTLRYPFRGHYQLRTPTDHSDAFSFSHPSSGVTLTVACPPDYRFSIEQPDTILTDDMWQFRKRAFLRSEHVTVRWFKSG